MKRIYLIICTIVVFGALVHAQDVHDSIVVSDQVGNSKTLVFGLDSVATDGIDTLFNEGLLPPFPPVGAFEARFFLPENSFSGTAASWRDFRNVASLPYTGQREFRLAYQLGTGSPGPRISWNFPPYLTGVLQDLFGGVLINVPISGTGFYNVTPTSIDRLKLLVTYTNVLPVELSSFTGSVIGGKVVLNWSTASEINNKGFEVERKSLSASWENIGFVEGTGNSTVTSSYSFVDENASGNIYNYRLKQIDLDGTFKYSKTIEINLTVKDYSLNQNYPNPFNPNTTIEFSIPADEYVSVKIFNMIGQEVATLFSGSSKAGIYKLNWDGKDNFGNKVTSGSYICRMSAGNFTETRKMVLIK